MKKLTPGYQNAAEVAALKRLGRMQTPDTVNAMTDTQLGQVLQDIGTAGPEAAMAAGGLAAQICQAVFDLPEQHQAVVKSLYALKGVEAAQALSKAPSQISKMKKEAFGFLREIVTAGGAAEEGVSFVSLNSGMSRRDNMDASVLKNPASPEDTLINRHIVACANAAMAKMYKPHRHVMDERIHTDKSLKEIGADIGRGLEGTRLLLEESLGAIRQKIEKSESGVTSVREAKGPIAPRVL